MFHGRAYTKERFFVIRTRPKLVSVPNKPSNFSVRSSLRGLQFLVTRRRPPSSLPLPSFSQSFVFPHPFPIPVSFSEPNLPHSFHRCTHGLNTGPPAIVTRGEAESFADRSRAEETLPTFLLLLFVQPSPLSLSSFFPAPSPVFLPSTLFHSSLTFAPSQLSSFSARSFPIHHSFRPSPSLPPVIADFYPRLHRSNPSLLFPPCPPPSSVLCSCVSMQSRPRIPRFFTHRLPIPANRSQQTEERTLPPPLLLLPSCSEELSVDRRFFAQPWWKSWI